MTSRPGTRLIHGIRGAWALVGPRERSRLRLIAFYGVLIAALDTVALVLVYALINLLNNQPVAGVARRLIGGQSANHDRYRVALILLGITATLFVLRSVLSVLGLWLTFGAANAADADLISRLLIGHARASQLTRLERNSSETLRTVLNSVDQVMYGVVASSVSLMSNGAVAAAVALALFLSSPPVAVAVTVYFAVIALAWVRIMRGGLMRRGLRVQELQKERYKLVLQSLSAAKELQLRGRALFYADGAVTRTRGINAAMRGANVINGSLRYMLESSLVVGAVLVVGAAGLTGGRGSVLPAVGLVLASAFRFLPALNQILFLTNQVQFNHSATDFVARELRIFASRKAEPVSTAPTAPLHFEHEFRLDGVTFRYPTRDEPALRSVSLSVRPGESVGIVGPTGSGKSTLLDVVLGMLEPEAGSVVIDGKPLRQCRDAWQRSIGYVPQDVYLVDDTLRANVALGWYDDEIDDERVREGIRLAGLDSVVADLPEGLETIVGERGVRLSGGQRQRVGLARALYTYPTVLVLDEATSNLDQATEQRIVDTLATLRGGVTMIIVTHRAASVRECNRVHYLENGAIVAAGTFNEVRDSVPEFDRPTSSRAIAQVG